MSDLPPRGGQGAPHGLPEPPPLPPMDFEPEAPPPTYESWTREPLIYYVVYLRGTPVGCLWASLEHQAAGLVLPPSDSEAMLYVSQVWDDRLVEGYGQGLPALDAVRRWRGVPEDPRGGGIAADEPERRAESLDALYGAVAPGHPAPQGPLVQDGKFADGTPADRAAGFGPLISALPPSYPEETDAAVRCLAVMLQGNVVGYVWASADGRAAGYLARSAAGEAGQAAAGLWKMWLSDFYNTRLSSLEALRRLKNAPEDRLSGVIGVGAEEQELPSLEALREMARA